MYFGMGLEPGSEPEEAEIAAVSVGEPVQGAGEFCNADGADVEAVIPRRGVEGGMVMREWSHDEP